MLCVLPGVRTHRNPDKSGKFRWYNDYRLPESLGASIVTVRLHGTDDDDARKLNRPENVRPTSPTAPDFARLYPRRNDAESINRNLDDTLWLRRAHSIGHDRQHAPPRNFGASVHRIRREIRSADSDQGADYLDRARLFTPTRSFLPGILQPPPS
jgi:hypothetical protein